MKKIRVDCVIVTYNRLSLLKECLKAVLNQKYKVNNIIVVNNNSTDNTEEFLNERMTDTINLKVVNMKQNLGGAGGFNIGFKYFMNKSNGNYLWIMDDDAIPHEDTLLELINKIPQAKPFGFLASNVKWIDGKPAVMNKPMKIGRDSNTNLIKIKSASFVSLLFPRDVIKDVGYPIKDFFIWGDDFEYCTRITQAGYKSYFVKNSTIVHKIYKNIPPNIIKETDKSRIKRYFYESRNLVYIFKNYYGSIGLIREILRYCFICLKLIFSNTRYKLKKIGYIIKGTVAGITFNPKIEKYYEE